MRLNAKQIANCTGGRFLVDPIDPTTLLVGVTWDSREVQPDWLFVALPGERADGHDFVPAALMAGAQGVLVTRPLDAKTNLLAQEMGAAIIEVPDTRSALSDLAREWRHHLRGRVIGLTGSVGKTTTKNLVRDVASAFGSVVATKGNQNNELGVPRTILAADPETAVVVVEMGMRGRGQIAELCDLVRPDWGLITNVGTSHIELLGSQEAIADAKAELLSALPAGTGCAFLPGTDGYLQRLITTGDLEARSVRSVFFGPEVKEVSLSEEGSPRVVAEDIQLDEEGRPSFRLVAQGFGEGEQSIRCSLGLRGIHNVTNATAAAAVGFALGLSAEAIVGALGRALPEQGRQEILKAGRGFTIINDCYNANPDSMRASLAAFHAMTSAGRKIAVLGDMGELGDFAAECHKGVGRAAADASLDLLICIGELAQGIADGAKEAGMDPSKIIEADSIARVLEELDVVLEEGDTVLVKASHSMGLTRVVEGLVR